MRVLSKLGLAVSVIFFLMATIFSASASVINYQGRLMQQTGTAVVDNTYAMQFYIYDASSGGNQVWTEINPSVQVKGGLFNVMLGSVKDIPDTVFNGSDRWFGVKVGSDPEMLPRQKIASVPYAVMAKTVPDGSITPEKFAPGTSGVPAGIIVMWSGASTQIPQGWTLCDGTNGTPDLKDRFIVGAGGGYQVGATGGEASVTLTTEQIPAHNHGVNDPGHNHSITVCIGWGTAGSNAGWGRLDANSGNPGAGWGTACSVAYTGISTQNTGGGQPHENRPPYYALCFIMKLAN